MQSTTNSECIPTLEFPEIPNKDEFVVSDVSSIFRAYTKSKLIVLPKLILDFYATRLYRIVLKNSFSYQTKIGCFSTSTKADNYLRQISYDYLTLLFFSRY